MWMRPRVVGRPLRALVFGICALLLVVAAAAIGLCTSTTQPLPNVSTYVAMTLIVPIAIVSAIALEEAGRPVRRVGRRLFGPGVAPGAGLRWHPRYDHVIDEYRGTKQLNEAISPNLFSVLREAMSPRVRTRVIFDEAPFEVGGRARVEFVASMEKQRVDPKLVRFYLRCFREDPDVILPWRRGVQCLADFTPARRRDGTDSGLTAVLEFPLPAGLPGSDLGAAKPTYWVFVAIIEGLDGPFREEFYVPVTAPAASVSS